MTGKTLGPLIAAIRRDRGWTLRKMSERIGIPLSTLAKIEANQSSLDFEKLQDVTARLGLSLAELLDYESGAAAVAPIAMTARRSLSDDSVTIREQVGNCDYDFLCADLKKKHMTPYVITVHRDDPRKPALLSAGSGDELIYVISGTVDVHTEFYSPIALSEGDSIYLDGSMEHGFTATGCDQAVILGVSSEHPLPRKGEE
jgi:transcriptional regulator with XRE-family HTH domain